MAKNILRLLRFSSTLNQSKCRTQPNE